MAELKRAKTVTAANALLRPHFIIHDGDQGEPNPHVIEDADGNEHVRINFEAMENQLHYWLDRIDEPMKHDAPFPEWKGWDAPTRKAVATIAYDTVHNLMANTGVEVNTARLHHERCAECHRPSPYRTAG